MNPPDTRSRRRISNFRFGSAAALLIGLGALCGCQTRQAAISQHEDDLAAAGFIVRPANTPEREAMLARLPPNKFFQHVNGDKVRYIYADPVVCKCLYVGSQQAYAQYRRDQQQKHLADEQQMTADTYNDAAWDWNAWGPWGPEYGLGFGPRLGW